MSEAEVTGGISDDTRHRPPTERWCTAVLVGVVLAAAVARLTVPGVSHLPGLLASVGAGALAVMGVAQGVLALAVLTVLRRLGVTRAVGGLAAITAVSWGVAVTGLAQHANTSATDTVEHLLGTGSGTTWGPIAVGVVEEGLKALGVLFVAVTVRDRLASARQTMLLGALVGLGFQVVENLDYAAPLALSDPRGAVTGALRSSLQRDVSGFLGAHWIYSALVGLALGLLVLEPRRRRLGVVLIVLVVAVHTAFDLQIAVAMTLGRGAARVVGLVVPLGTFVGFAVVAHRFREPGTSSGADLAVWSTAAGGVGLVAAAAAPYAGSFWLAGLPGVVLGFLALRGPDTSRRGLAGVVLSALALALGILVLTAAVPPPLSVF